MSTRIYKVTNKETNQTVLVEATSQGQAVRFVTASKYDVATATSKDVASVMIGGGKLYRATNEKEETQDEPTNQSGSATKQLGGE